jgi:16S rRNA (cytosine1402-N4)-methyltransferase
MSKHIPVMLPTVLEYLDPTAGDVVLDGTVGSGGYARAITTSLGPGGTLVGIDADKTAIAATAAALSDYDGRLCLETANFRTLKQVLSNCGIEALDGAVFDLGFRSEQLEMERGFSFQESAPLIMTFKHPDELESTAVTAYQIVNDWSVESLSDILTGYGDERYAHQIAAAIRDARKFEAIETTDQLVRIIKKNVPRHYRFGRTHPATRTFQAIRIAVNDEIGALKTAITDSFGALKPGGRLVIVSFHSLEDRTVKQYFQTFQESGAGKLLTDGPATPETSEIDFNPRARSAKLRAIEKMSN